jgi:hypothetical protein
VPVTGTATQPQQKHQISKYNTAHTSTSGIRRQPGGANYTDHPIGNQTKKRALISSIPATAKTQNNSEVVQAPLATE